MAARMVLRALRRREPELAVALAIVETLPMRFQRGFVRCHVFVNLRKPLILAQWPLRSSTSAAPTQARAGSVTAVERPVVHRRRGEIVGLIGPNGAGKTTTLRSLAGILRPTCRRVGIDGHDIVDDPLEAKRRLAFMPDEPHLFEYLTVEEHLRLVARLRSWPISPPGGARSSRSSS